MGRIAGDVYVFGLASILEDLSKNRCEGVLTVSQEAAVKVIHFGPQGFRLLVGSRRGNPLGEILLRFGKLTRLQIHELLQEQRVSQKPLGRLVVDKGLLSQEVIDGALREQVAEEIYELFTWSKAKFEFVTGDEGPAPAGQGPLAALVLDTSMMQILLEAARRLDEMARIEEALPDMSRVPVGLGAPVRYGEADLNREAVEEILTLADGVRSVNAVVRESLYPRFTVLQMIRTLVAQGVLGIRDRNERTRPTRVLPVPKDSAPAEGTPGQTVLHLQDLPILQRQMAVSLIFAASQGRVPTIQKLLGGGVYIDARDEDGYTALIRAARNSDSAEVVTLLLDHGANINAQRNSGATALMDAAAANSVAVVQALLQRGADPALKDLEGKTALDHAREKGRPDLIELLTPKPA